jgi:hypothetical protein
MLSRAQQSPLGRLKGNKFKAPLGCAAFLYFNCLYPLYHRQIEATDLLLIIFSHRLNWVVFAYQFP